jgi:hypothetical protein
LLLKIVKSLFKRVIIFIILQFFLVLCFPSLNSGNGICQVNKVLIQLSLRAKFR